MYVMFYFGHYSFSLGLQWLFLEHVLLTSHLDRNEIEISLEIES